METQEELKITRIIFIKKFSEEIIHNLVKKHDSKLNIEAEKLKKRFLLQKEDIPESYAKIINHKILHPVKYQKVYKEPVRKQPAIRKQISPQQPAKSTQSTAPASMMDPEKIKVLQSIHPEYKPKPTGFTLGKIEPILQDNLIQTIECPGPGKNVLVKKLDKINVTKITLSQDEINQIIIQFSNQSKIPLLGGILKAAVGNMLISAVTSDFAGSRFIINRINPNISVPKSY